MAVTEQTFILADHDHPAGGSIGIPAGLYQLVLNVPDPFCEAHLQRLQGDWVNVIGLKAEPPDHGDPEGPRTFRPLPERLPDCMVRLQVPGRFSTTVTGTLTLIG